MSETLIMAGGICIENRGLPMLAVFIAGSILFCVGCAGIGHAVGAFMSSVGYRLAVAGISLPLMIIGLPIVHGMLFVGTGGFCG